MWPAPETAPAERRRAGVRRGGVAAGLPGQRPGLRAPRAGGRRRRRRLARRLRRDRRVLRRAATPGCGSCTPTNRGLGAARNEGLRHVRGDVRRLLRLRRRRARRGVRRDAGGARAQSRSDFVTGSIVRWEADGLHEPPWMRRLHADGAGLPAHRRRPPRDPRRRLRLEQGVPAVVLGRARGWRGPRGCATRTSPTTTRAYLLGAVRRDARRRLPLADPRRRHVDHPAARPRSRDLADRIVTKRMSLASVRELGGPEVAAGLRGPGAGRRPAALLRARSPAAPTSGGSCCATWCASSGASGRSCTAACPRCTGSSAGWSSRDRREDAAAVMDLRRGAWARRSPGSSTTAPPPARRTRAGRGERGPRRARPAPARAREG